MKQKSSRVLTEKTENASVGNAQAQRRKRICPKAPTENGSKENRIEADRRGPPVRFKKLAGARRLRWTPASNHGETRRSECTKSFSLPHRWVVDSSNGEHHVDGDTISGGRRLG